MIEPSPLALDRMFHALSDASRREMVGQLSRGPASVKQLASPLGMALPSVLKHLQVLESGGIVESEKLGRVRTFRMVPSALTALDTWLKKHKDQLNQQFDALERYLDEVDDPEL
jgi:DNA-binding transcriptional ArsR family regulator